MNNRAMQKTNGGLHFPEFLSEILSDHRPMATDKLGEKFDKLGEKFDKLGEKFRKLGEKFGMVGG